MQFCGRDAELAMGKVETLERKVEVFASNVELEQEKVERRAVIRTILPESRIRGGESRTF